ncbi:MAG: alpha-amylase, partial [Bacillota bacterium]
MFSRRLAKQNIVVVLILISFLFVGCSSSSDLDSNKQTGQLQVSFNFSNSNNNNQMSVQNISDQTDKVTKIKVMLFDLATDEIIEEKTISKDQELVPFTLGSGEYKVKLTAIQETSTKEYILYEGTKQTNVTGSNTTDLKVDMNLKSWDLKVDVSNLESTEFSAGNLILSNPVDGRLKEDFNLADNPIELTNIVPGNWKLELILLGNQTEKRLETDIFTLPNRSKQVVVDLNQSTPLQVTETTSGAEEEVDVISEEYPKIPEGQQNQTMMQAFYWNMGVNTDVVDSTYYTAKTDYGDKYSEEKQLWDLIADRASDFAEVGITELWLPPAHKSSQPHKVGYAVYDLWDLGEFDQKDSVATKYGTKEELKEAIDTLHNNDIAAYYDIVLNQRMGADATETVPLENGGEIKAWTAFNDMKGRQEYYSKANDFDWDWKTFDGVDYDADKGQLDSAVLFEGKSWDDANPDYLLGTDVDYQNEDVQDEVKEWGQWVIDDVGFDGFRIDAIKHVHTPFVSDWLDTVQKNTNKDVFYVGEAWISDISPLQSYLDEVGYNGLTNFDFPLRGAFAKMSSGGYDISQLSSVGLVNSSGYRNKAVTFLDNHDTHRDGNPYDKPQIEKFKYQAYAYILMREQGLPTIFWKDYYQHGMKEELDKLLEARKYFAYGTGHEVSNNDDDVYSYVREGL